MKSSLVFACIIFASCSVFQSAEPRHLFNGKDLSGWHADVPEMDTNKLAKSPFIVRNGVLVSLASPEGHLITDEVFLDYRLLVEYRFPGKTGNCGVLVHASTPRALYGMFPQSLEVQLEHGNAGDFWCIAEDIEVPDMEKRRGPKSEWGVTNGKRRRILNLADNAERAPGQWNTMKIECKGNTIKVWVNDQLVNEGTNCTASKGRIALQAEGTEVEFRKVDLETL